MRIVVALVAAVVLNFVIVFVAEMVLGHLVHHHGTDRSPAAFMAAIPFWALVFLLVAWAAAALAACFAAVAIVPGHRWVAWAAAAMPLFGALSNFVMLPHPWWMMVVGTASPFAAALTASRRRMRAV